jgi:hypothetical protein
MTEFANPQPADVDRLIADVVRASSKVHWCRSRWESDEQACREEAAAIAALRAAFESAVPRPPPAAALRAGGEPGAVAADAPGEAPAGLPPPGVELRFEGQQLLEAVGHGRFHLEQMSANHWWAVFEAGGRRVDVWLHAKGTINATFESVQTGSAGEAPSPE